MGGLHLQTPRQKSKDKIRHKSAQGFTIVETMVVLAVTGVLFFSVVTVMAGRQNKTRFQQGINAAKVEIEQIISEVQTGYYPNMQNFKCAAGAGGDVVITSAAVGNEQGTNKDCVFLGKALQFSVTDEGGDKYAAYPLAGLRTATSLATTRARAVGQAAELKMLQYGIEPRWVRPAGGGNVGAVGFVTSFDAVGSGSQGSQSVRIVPVATSTLNQTVDTARAIIDANMVSSPVSNGVRICYESGTTDQHGIVSISGGGAVSLEIDNGGCPA